MKIRSLFAILAIGVGIVSCSDSQLKVDGEITGLSNDRLIVSKIEKNRPVAIDTVSVDSLGKFTYTETLKEAAFRLFASEKNRRFVLPVFVGNESVSIKGDANNVKELEYSGSESQTLYMELSNSLDEVQKDKQALYQEANQAYAQKDSLKLESLKDAIEQNEKKMFDTMYDFAAKNNSSVLAPFVLNNFISGDNFKAEKVIAIFETFSNDVKNSTYGKELKERLDRDAKLAVGNTPPDFTLKTTAGEDFTLSAQKGKVVLVDFWAHWCNPCRKENPNNVKLYAKYAADGFVIAAISLDRDDAVDKWMEAIKTDGLEYPQMRDTIEFGIH